MGIGEALSSTGACRHTYTYIYSTGVHIQYGCMYRGTPMPYIQYTPTHTYSMGACTEVPLCLIYSTYLHIHTVWVHVQRYPYALSPRAKHVLK